MKKKIIYIITPSNSIELIGGTNRRILNWMTSIELNTYDIKLLISGHNINDSKKITSAYKDRGIRTVYIPNLTFPKYLLPWNFIRFYRFLKREKPTIIHTLLIQSDILGGLAKLFKLTNIHVSSLEGALYPKNTFKSLFYAFVFEHTKKQTDKFIALCNYTKNQAELSYGVNRNKITIINSGIKLEEFPFKNNLITKFSKRQVTIGFLGRIHNEKCIHQFIDTALFLIKNNYPVNFIIGGNGPELKSIKRRIQEDSAEDKIKLVGFVSDTNAFFEKIDLLLFLSVAEGLPWTILEAQAKGVIVIASAVGGVPEIIENNINGFLIHNNNVSEISSAIISIIHNKTNINPLIMNGRKKVEKQFEYSLEVNSVSTLYQNLIH